MTQVAVHVVEYCWRWLLWRDNSDLERVVCIQKNI